MTRVWIVASLTATLCVAGACYVVTGAFACADDGDCPEDQRCLDTNVCGPADGAKRVPCDLDADCGEDRACVQDTDDDDGEKYCADSCDVTSGRLCNNDQNEFCLATTGTCGELPANVETPCDTDDDCPGFDAGTGFCAATLADFVLGCQFTVGGTCSREDDNVCAGSGYLCDTKHYRRCLGPSLAVGSCPAGLLTTPGDAFLVFVNSVDESDAACPGDTCFDVTATIIDWNAQTGADLGGVGDELSDATIQLRVTGFDDEPLTATAVSITFANANDYRATLAFTASVEAPSSSIAFLAFVIDDEGVRSNAACGEAANP